MMGPMIMNLANQGVSIYVYGNFCHSSEQVLCGQIAISIVLSGLIFLDYLFTHYKKLNIIKNTKQKKEQNALTFHRKKTYSQTIFIFLPNIYPHVNDLRIYYLETMYTDDQEIEIVVPMEATLIDSDIQELLKTHTFVYEAQLKRPTRGRFKTSCRRKSPKNLQQTLLQAIPGREGQIKQVCKFVENLKMGERTPLCLNGSTGCGKTSIIKEMLRFLEGDPSNFNVIYLNCMCISHVRNIYSSLMEQLFGAYDKKPEAALNIKFHQDNQSKIINLVVLDEIDQFLTARNFIYNLLEWLGTGKVRLGVIMVSNMADLAVNLSSKLKSRLKFNTITFSPYRYQELMRILEHKYPNESKKFSQDAIVYLCKKVASINSDVRLLEKYFHEAVKNFQANHESIVGKFIHIEQVSSLFSPKQQSVRTVLEPYQFLMDFLVSSPKQKNISDEIRTFCFTKNIPEFSESQITDMLTQLEQMGLLTLRYDRALQCDYRYRNYGINLTDFAYLLEATK